jgi:predicted amidohydrolase YtcJ
VNHQAPLWTILLCVPFFGTRPALATTPRAADLVLRGGKVVTVDELDRVAEAVAISGNRILAVGSDTEIAAFIDGATEIVELSGRAVVPGFIDAHTHLQGTAEALYFRLPVQIPPLANAKEVLEKVRARVQELPPGTWVVGQGTYGQPMPSPQELDRVAPDHPVVLRWSAHDGVANAKALRVSGIDRATPDPPGGRIEKGPDGEPNGYLREAMHLLATPEPSYDETRDAIQKTFMDPFLSNGVTSVYTMPHRMDALRIYQELRDEGQLPLRLTISFFVGEKYPFDLDALLSTGIRTGWGDDRLKVGGIKIVLDGVWGTTAVTYDPNPGTTDNYGLPSRTPEVLNEEVEKAHRAGWQVWIHANGDRAQDLALDAIEKAMTKFPRPDPRHRIEHMGNFVTSPKGVAALERARRLGVIPIPQVAFLFRTTEEDAVRENWVSLYALKTLLGMGFHPPGSSDTLGTQSFAVNPWFPIRLGVVRTSKFGALVHPDEAISVMDGIRMHTIWSAYSGFEETIKGSIESGKLADLVVLSGDPLNVPPSELLAIHADLTFVDGKLVYRRQASR